MKKIIYNLRRQPEAVRRHILHVSTIVAGVILVLLWIYSLGTGLANALKANLIGGYQSITESKTDTE